MERDFTRQSRAQEIAQLAQGIGLLLSGEEGLLGRLAAILREARQLESLDPASKALADRLQSASVELADLDAEFSALGQSVNFEPEQAVELQAKMDAWLELKRKHGAKLETVIAAREAMRRQLDAQGDIASTLARLEKQIAEAEKAARKLAA